MNVNIAVPAYVAVAAISGVGRPAEVNMVEARTILRVEDIRLIA